MRVLSLARLLIVTILLGLTQAQNNCGAPQCYYPCTDSRPLVDFVFMIDVSASLENIIASVLSGLYTFITSLNNNQINPAFALVTFGNDANAPYQDGVLNLQLTTSASNFVSVMSGLSTSGYIEPGLEVLNQVMNNAAASSSNLNIAFRTGQNTQKVFILVTNEDADMAAYQNSAFNANLFGVQNWYSYTYNGCCYNYQGNYPNYRGFQWITITSSEWASWQEEVNSVYQAIIENDAYLYMFVPGQQSLSVGQEVDISQTCNTIYQYCNPDIQFMNADYTNFDAATTYSNLVKNSSQTSLQGMLLNAGKTARCFEVQDLNGNSGSTLIANFFSEVIANLGACDTTCYNYTCLTPSECNAPISICDCAGVPYSTCQPAGTCTGLDVNGKCCLKSTIAYNNVCCNGDLDPCKVCTATGAPSSTCLVDCNGGYYLSGTTPPYHYDPCQNCIPASQTVASTCITDCAGSYYNTSRTTPPHFIDDCNVCVVAGTPAGLGKDYCGVCFGNNATLNQCGECNQTQAIDGCGNPVCKNITCKRDCNNGSYTGSIPPYHYDNCKNCILTNYSNPTANAPQCVQDCAGTWYNTGTTPPHYLDNCGNCLAAGTTNPQCVQDCAKVWFNNITGANPPDYINSCGECIARGTTDPNCMQDCAGDWYINGTAGYPINTIDSCGICDNATFHNYLVDKCGICTNTPGYNSTAECTQDCKGQWSLVTINGFPNPNRAFVDQCKVCWFANQTNMRNSDMDACGVCYAYPYAPGWNQETAGFDTQGIPCHCGETPTPCLGTNLTTCNDHCPVTCSGGVLSDPCDRCPGDPYYNTGFDDCGQCATASQPPNSEKDYCGVCFGNNASLATNPCHICNASDCYVDCNGTPLGTAKYDACGVCGGDNSTCDLCANGQTQTANGCVDAAANNNAGAIAGGIIGGLVGLLVLALAAFFAVQYAKKNGLIGNANKQLDMAASNSNPLYKNAVQVQHNPLYGQS